MPPESKSTKDTRRKRLPKATAIFENMNDHSLLELVESLKGKRHKGSKAILAARSLRVAIKRGLISE